MKNYIFLIFCLSIILISCEKDNEESNSSVTQLTITVYNATDWSVSQTSPLCNGATVNLITSSDTISGISGEDGKVVFNDLEVGTYNIIVTKGDLSNLIEKDAATNRGYIAIGIFQSMAEISDYTNDLGELLQPDAEPGDLKIVDVNADGIINSDDKVLSDSYSFIPYVDINADGIVNEDDKIDGSYRYLENVDKIVYIGQ